MKRNVYILIINDPYLLNYVFTIFEMRMIYDGVCTNSLTHIVRVT